MLLTVKDLCIRFNRTVAVNHINFSLVQGETLAIVGESGSGKSVTALSLAQLLPRKSYCEVTGEILINGENILRYNEHQLRKIRGKQVAYVFQDPSTSLNPSLTIGFQIGEAVRLHQPEHKNVKKVVLELLYKVGLDPERCYKSYPFELSGGMQQRAMIAMALGCCPKILVADEPTTALDVTLQKQIMDLIKHLQEQENLSVILITHNLSLVKNFADTVLVMFKGEIVERGSTEKILHEPQHPYTRALLQCIPSLKNPKQRLTTIEDCLCTEKS